VGDIFHAAAVAEGAEVVRRARECGKQRTQPPDRLTLAAGVDHQVFDLGLRAGAAHRTIQHDVAGPAQRALRLELVVDRKRAHLHDDPSVDPGADDRLYRRIECGRLGQAGDDGPDLGGERLCISGNLYARARHGAAAGGIDVIAHDAPAGRHEVARERASHDAKPDDADASLRHYQSPLADPSDGGRYTAISPAFKRDLRISRSRAISPVPNPLSSRRLRNDMAVRGKRNRRQVRCKSASPGSVKWARPSRSGSWKSDTRSPCGTAPPINLRRSWLPPLLWPPPPP